MRPGSADAGQEFGCLAFQLEPRVLVRLVARHGGDALHEVEHRLRRPAFLVQHGGDDLLRLWTREAALAQEGLAVFITSGDDGLARRPNAGDERRGRGVGEPLQRWRCLVGEAMPANLEW